MLASMHRTALGKALPLRGAGRSIKPAPVRAMASGGNYKLIDAPVSNNGARVRWVNYKKNLLLEIVPPTTLGGLKSPEYLALNPQGKMPLLLLPEGNALPESEVIVQYLCDKFSGQGPELRPDTPEARAVGHLVTRLVDVYITPIQSCMYRKMDSAQQRAEHIGQLNQQLDAIEHAIRSVASPFITGSQITTADGALFPTMVFMQYILPKYFGWGDLLASRPKLAVWWAAVQKDPEASKVIDELNGGLEKWDQGGRWQEQGIVEQVTKNPQLKWSY